MAVAMRVPSIHLLRGTASVEMHSQPVKVWQEQKPLNYSVLTYPHLRLSAPLPPLPAELDEPVPVSFSNRAESDGIQTIQRAVGGGAERQTVDSEMEHAFCHMTNNFLQRNAVKSPFTAAAAADFYKICLCNDMLQESS